MEELRTNEKILRWIGVLEPLKGFPGLLAVVIVSIALAEAVAFSHSVPSSSVTIPMRQLIIVVLGTLLGMIGYTAGNFWDRTVFNRLYGLCGKRIERPASGFFPSGTDLKSFRDAAITAIRRRDAINGNDPPLGSNGERVYRRSTDIVRGYSKIWAEVEKPIILSKIARSFIWPFVLAAVLSLPVYVVAVVLTLPPETVALASRVLRYNWTSKEDSWLGRGTQRNRS